VNLLDAAASIRLGSTACRQLQKFSDKSKKFLGRKPMHQHRNVFSERQMGKLWVRTIAGLVLAGGCQLSAAQHLAGLGVATITPCTASLARTGACRADHLDLRGEDLTSSGGSGAIVTAVHSELTARALVIQDASGRRAVIAAIDVLLVDEQWSSEVKALIQQQHPGLRASDIVINASHTHSAPALVDLSKGVTAANGVAPEPPPSARFRSLTKDRMVSAVQRAFSSLQPAKLEFRRGKSHACAYRRDDGRSSRVEPASATLDTLTIRAANGSALGIVATAGCHSVAMYGAGSVISADFIGVTRANVEEALWTQPNARPIALYLQGFAGDMNPLAYQLGRPAFEAVSQTGAKLASEILSLNRFPAPPLSGPLASSNSTLNLPLSPEKTAWAHDGSRAMPIGVQVLQIGADQKARDSWTLMAFGGEVVSEYESNVRSNWDTTKNLTLISYTNNIPSYVPTQRMIATDALKCGLSPGGYEGCYSFCLRYLPVANWTDEQFYPNRERFGDSLRDGNLWVQGVLSTAGGADISSPLVQSTETAGSLRISPVNASGLRYGGYVTTKTHDFQNKQFGVRVVSTPNAQTLAEAAFSIGSSGKDLYRFDIQAGRLRADALVAGAATYVPLGAFDSNTHRYLRLRHDAASDRIHWESSTNGSSWVALHSRARDASFKLSIVRAELIAGTYSSVAAPGTAVFDDAVFGTAYRLPRQAGFVERFEDSAAISKEWTEAVLSSYQSNSVADPFVDVFAGGGRVEIKPSSSAAPGLRYNGLSTRDSFQFTGRRAVFQVLGTFRRDRDAEMAASVYANGNHLYRFQIHRDVLRADTLLNGVPSYTNLASFDAYAHRFVSIRHDVATDRIFWEASHDGVSWRVLHSTPRSSNVDLSSVQFELFGGTYGTGVSNPGTAVFGALEFR
jgi:hypothetical protein